MPKSRRDRPISLTQAKKHDKSHKSSLIEQIHTALDEYPRVFLFSVANARNAAVKELREQLRADSRFFQGKVAVMSLALGRSEQSEYRPQLSRMTRQMQGQCGLLFTHRSVSAVQALCSEFAEQHFARSGCVASSDFTLYAGHFDSSVIAHPMEPQLRKLGLPTRLDNARVELLRDVAVCKQGDILTPEQCKILQLFDQKQAEMRIQVCSVYEFDATTQQGEFMQLQDASQMAQQQLAMDDDDDDEAEPEFVPQHFEVPTASIKA